MTRGPLLSVARHCRRVAGSLAPAEKTDGQLLEAYLGRRDDTAFEAIVRRHGPMVLGVCRRVARHEQDAEDAFQAAFLVLARKAAHVFRGGKLAGWLYRVAVRAAVAARSARQRSRGQPMDILPEPLAAPASEEWSDVKPVLDEELDGLPELYRLPILLCDVQGRPRKEAARELKIPEGTLSSRLAAGRKQLAARLARRGVMPSACVGALLAQAATAGVPAPLLGATVKSISPFASGQAAGAVSARVAALAEGVLKGMLMTRLKTVLALVVCAAAAGLMAHRAPLSPPQAAARQTKPAAEPGDPRRVDRHGDALPPKALARLGTVRFRHGSSVDSLAYSPDGKTLSSVDWWSRTVCVWDAATGKPVWRFRGAEPLAVPGFLPGGKVLAVACHGATPHLKLLDAASGKELRQVEVAYGIQLRAVSPDGKRVAAGPFKADELRVYDVATGNEAVRIAANRLLAVAYSADGKTIAGAGADGAVRLWESATGKERLTIDAPVANRDNAYLSLVYSPDGRTLALAEGNAIRLWDTTTGQELRRIQGHRGEVGALAFSPDGKSLASGGQDRTVRLWDVLTGTEIRQLGAHLSWVQAVTFSPDGKAVASGGQDNMLRQWDVATGKEIGRREGHESRPTTLAVSPDGKTVVTGGFHDGLRVWDIATGKQLRTLPHHEGVMAVAFSPKGDTLAAAGWEGSVRLWDVAAAKELRRFVGHKGGVCAAAFSPDGKALVTGGDDKAVRVWEVSTGKEARRLLGHEHNVRTVAVSPDGKAIASGSLDCTVRVWDFATGNELRRIGERPAAHPLPLVHAVAFSPDAKALACSVQHSSVLLLEVATGKQLQSFERETTDNPRRTSTVVAGGVAETTDLGPSRSVGGLAFSPDGRWLATAEDDHMVFVWDVTTGKPRSELAGHHGAVRSVAFTPDGKRLVSLSADLTALVWPAP